MYLSLYNYIPNQHHCQNVKKTIAFMQYTIQSLLWCHLYHKPKITQCGKTRNSLSQKNNSSNQRFSNFIFCKKVAITNSFSKWCVSKFCSFHTVDQ